MCLSWIIFSQEVSGEQLQQLVNVSPPLICPHYTQLRQKDHSKQENMPELNKTEQQVFKMINAE